MAELSNIQSRSGIAPILLLSAMDGLVFAGGGESPHKYHRVGGTSALKGVIAMMSALLEFQEPSTEELLIHKALVARIRRCPNRQWVNDYLDLAKEIIREFGITEDDPRLVVSMPKAGKLPITVNQRYILSGMPNGTVGLIMPCDYTPGRDEKVDPNYFFNCMHIREALWVESSFPQRIRLPEKVVECWKMSLRKSWLGENDLASGGFINRLFLQLWWMTPIVSSC